MRNENSEDSQRIDTPSFTENQESEAHFNGCGCQTAVSVRAEIQEQLKDYDQIMS